MGGALLRRLLEHRISTARMSAIHITPCLGRVMSCQLDAETLGSFTAVSAPLLAETGN